MSKDPRQKHIKCQFCPKWFPTTVSGIKNLNFHVSEEHPMAYPYRIKPMFDSLIEELKCQDLDRIKSLTKA